MILALSTKVQVELVEIFPKLNVTADDGHVYIDCYGKNVIIRDEVLSKIKVAAERVDGVTEVTMNISGLGHKDSHQHVNPFHNIGS